MASVHESPRLQTMWAGKDSLSNFEHPHKSSGDAATIKVARYRAWMDAEYPGGLVKHLDSIGLLSPRLSLANCVGARPEELELLAERGVTILISNSSNLHPSSGIAPVVQNA